MSEHHPSLQYALQLIEADELDEAASVLGAIEHPMTQIWLRHLEEGGRERLMLKDSLSRHSAEDPQVDELRQLIEAERFEEAETKLQELAHPMTQIWLRHLREGGRRRLELEQSIALHAEDPRIQTVAELIEKDDVEAAEDLLESINHPMTLVWRDHLRAGGLQRLVLEADDEAAASSEDEDEGQTVVLEMDERMRRAKELMLNKHAPPPPAAAAPRATKPIADDSTYHIVQTDDENVVSWLQRRETPTPAVSGQAGPVSSMRTFDLLRDAYLMHFSNNPALVGVASMVGLMMLLTLLSAGGLGGLVLSGVVLLTIFTILAKVETQALPAESKVQRSLILFGRTLGVSEADLSQKVAFTGELPPPLHIPPSLSAIKIGPVGAKSCPPALQSQLLMQTTMFSLWAWGQMEIREARVQHQVGDSAPSESQTHWVLIAKAKPEAVQGTIERQIINYLAAWPQDNLRLRRVSPWLIGPSIEDLGETIGKSGAQLLAMVMKDGESNGYLKRGMFRGVHFSEETAATATAEAHNLVVLMRRIAITNPVVHQRIVAAAAQATNTMPAYELGVMED